MAHRPRKLAKHEEEIRNVYRNGATISEIAAVHQVSQGTVRNLLKELGEPLRKKGRRPKNLTNPYRDTEMLNVDELPSEEPLVEVEDFVEEEVSEEEDLEFGDASDFNDD